MLIHIYIYIKTMSFKNENFKYIFINNNFYIRIITFLSFLSIN